MSSKINPKIGAQLNTQNRINREIFSNTNHSLNMNPNKKRCTEVFSKVVDSNGRRRDSFDRFGDDLTATILSYLPINDKYRYCMTSNMFFNNMFSQTRLADISDFLFSPIRFWDFERFSPATTDRIFDSMERNQYHPITSLYANIGANCFQTVVNFYNKCPNVRRLKIDGGNRKISHISDWTNLMANISVKPPLRELYLGSLFVFQTQSNMDFFIHRYIPVLKEVGVVLNYMVELPADVIIANLHRFPNVEVLNIAIFNSDGWTISMAAHKTISKALPRLKKLNFYLAMDNQNDILYDVDRLTRVYPHLTDLYVGPMLGGQWTDPSFMKSAMEDMAKFGPVRRAIFLDQHSTTLRYSKKYKWVFFVQRNKRHQLILPTEVNSIVFHYFDKIYRASSDVAMLKALLNRHPNIRQIRVNKRAYTISLLKYLTDRAKRSPEQLFCYATNQWSSIPMEKYFNVLTDIPDFKHGFKYHNYLRNTQ